VEESADSGLTSDVFSDLPHHRSPHPYSLRRALAMAQPDSRPSGLEGEVSAEISRRSTRAPRGIFVPHDVPIRRNLWAGTSGSGSIQTTVPYTLFDALRAKLVLAKLGANIGDFGGGDRGQVALPVKSASANVSWVSEDQPAPSQTNMKVGQALLQAHTCTAYTDVSRRMIVSGTPGFEAFIENDLALGIAVAIDADVLNGPGSSNRLLGLFQTTSWTQFAFLNDTGNGSKPDYVTLCAMESAIGGANADAGGNVRIGWVTSPPGRSALRRCDLGGATVTGRYAWKAHRCYSPSGEVETVESVLGHAAVSTANVPSNITKGSGTNLAPLLAGNFGHLFMQMWSAVDFVVNPYLQSTGGIVRISAFQDTDYVCLYPGISFVVAPAMITS
jgi:HK97 family phage major capsid protein